MPPNRSFGKTSNSTKLAKITRPSVTESHSSITQHSRATDTHVFFWGGILSNWYLTSPPFSGARCIEIMIPKLDRLGIAHPSPNALSTQILAAHQFLCGEQWMMAVKAWLFERSSILGEMLVNLDPDQHPASDRVIERERFELLKLAVMQSEPPKHFTSDPDQSNLYGGTLYAILRSSTPREQKAMGRKVSGFDNAIWNEASASIVVASCIARAEEDPDLRCAYNQGATRAFVEGSPMDKIWGVGLKWDNPLIDDETNWRGENRLGKCHDEAARYIREKFSSE